jgi:hypothetical protein
MRRALLLGIAGGVAISIVAAIAVSLASSQQQSSSLDAIQQPEAGTITGEQPSASPTEDESNAMESSGFFEGAGNTGALDESASAIDRPSSGDTVVYQVYTEPREQAFTMLIPQGWAPSSNVALSASGVLKVEFLATSPDGLKSIGFQKPSAVSYVMPSGYFTQEGLASHEGAIEYYYYRTSDQFVEQILLPKLETALATDLQVSGAMPIASGQGYSAGLYEFLYSKDGTDFVMQMIITTYAGVITPSGEIYSWEATLDAVSAPQNEFGEYSEMGWNALGSMSANPAFIQRYLQGAGESSAALSRSLNDSFFPALHSIQQSQSNLDTTFQGLSDATLGFHKEVDSNGQTYTVPNSHSSWYVGSSTGNLYGTNTGGPPPADENVVPLQPSG